MSATRSWETRERRRQRAAAWLGGIGLSLALGLTAAVARGQEDAATPEEQAGVQLELPADTQPLPDAMVNASVESIETLESALGLVEKDAVVACWLDRLKQPGVDDRVVPWTRICPVEGKNEAICALTSVGAEALSGIRSVAEVESVSQALGEQGFIVHLRSDVLRKQVLFPAVVNEIPYLRIFVAQLGAMARDVGYADSELARASGAPYVAIRGWVEARKRDPKSVYACLARKE